MKKRRDSQAAIERKERTMSIKDVIKKSVLESDMYNQAISLSTILTMMADLLLALVMGLLIYAVYKKFYKGVVFSRNYAITLVGMTVLTSMVTLAISTNIVISLGMVGALSIVRYRTAIKEPLDLMYMFWAITTGIAIGASMYILAGAAFVIMLILVLGFGAKGAAGCQYMLVVHYNGDGAGDNVIRALGKSRYTVRSKIMRGDSTELTVQVRCKNDNQTFMENIRGVEGVNDSALIAFDGEYHG